MTSPTATLLSRLPLAASAILVGCVATMADEPAQPRDLLAVDGPTPTTSSVTSSALSPTIERWLAYRREPTFTAVTTAIRVPMRDGKQLACTLKRPGSGQSPAPGKHPGLLVELTPYALLAGHFDSEASFFATRGYNTLVCTLRGVGGSADTWKGAFASQDRRDAFDLVEWLASQPFSDGRIGVFGESYGGSNAYAAAVERPPHLRAIAPLQAPSDLYQDVNYPGGIEAKRDGTINNWPPVAELMSFLAINAKKQYDEWSAHPTYDAYWQERAMKDLVPAIEVPILAVGGWVDGYFRSGTLANIEAKLDRTWVFYGQWPHTYPVELVSSCSFCAQQPLPSGVLLAWFDRWVMELATAPIPDKPTFVSEEGPRGASRGWRELSHWPSAGGDEAVMMLGADGKLSADAREAATLTFQQPGEADVPGAALTFTTDRLDRDHVVLGHPKLRLRASLSAPDANLYVTLVDVDEDGKETLVNDGFLKASHRATPGFPTPVPVGEPSDYVIAIRPAHHRFAVGHRARIRLWGGPKNMLVPAPPVRVEIEAGGASMLSLPGFANH